MLVARRNVTIVGNSVIDGVDVEGYQATISSENPLDMEFSTWQIDKARYKENRATCRQDAADFEDMAYTIQDEMLAEQASMQLAVTAE